MAPMICSIKKSAKITITRYDDNQVIRKRKYVDHQIIKYYYNPQIYYPLVPRRKRTPRYEVNPQDAIKPFFEDAALFPNQEQLHEDEDDEEAKEILTMRKKKGLMEEEERKTKKNKKTCPPPELSHKFTCYIHNKFGDDVVPILVIQKELTKTDMDLHQSRLSMPSGRINSDFVESFLTQKERDGAKGTMHIKVKLLVDRESTDDDGVVPINSYNVHHYLMSFTMWRMSTSSIYVLTTDWNTVSIQNKLKAGMLIQLWAFREGLQLCFALAAQKY